MARKLIKKEPIEIEEIVIDSLERVGIKASKDRARLLLRLIFSGISNYFFIDPDSIIDIGFMRFKKNPSKDELFSLDILRNGEEGVVNAGTLWRYYKGELATEAELKGLLGGFMDELIAYSQVQEAKISKDTVRMSVHKRK